MKRLTAALLVLGLSVVMVGASPDPATAAVGGSISGYVPAFNTKITLYSASTGQALATTDTLGHGGDYTFSDLAPGDYKIGFVDIPDTLLGAPSLYPEFWNDKPTLESADVITISGSESVTGIDAELAPMPPAISGTIAGEGGTFSMFGERDFRVYELDGTPVQTDTVRVDPGGVFKIWGIPAGTYYLSARYGDQIGSGFATTFLGDVPVMSLATPLEVEDDVTTAVGTITMPVEAKIRGGISSPESIDGVRVQVLRFNEDTAQFEETPGPVKVFSGQYSARGLWPGRYLVRFYDVGGLAIGPQWWNGARFRYQAEEIVLSEGQEVTDINATLGYYSWAVDRVSGPDRYETSVGISRELFPDPQPGDPPLAAPVVYVANGLNFPDALSAGAAAAHLGGGLLLVSPDEIPPVTLAELRRIHPQRIVVVGGEGAVSSTVVNQLRLIATTKRVGGADRYSTSQLIVDDAFGCDSCTGAESIFVATGSNYPDALAAGPAAAQYDAPVLIVPGSEPSLDGATASLLTELGTEQAFIAGGLATVSSGIENSLNGQLAHQSIRYAGADRYETAQLMNDNIFGESVVVFLASGAGFADALAGGPLAAAYGAPLYLSQPTCVPIEILFGAADRQSDVIVLLGGSGALSTEVENLQVC